MSKKVAVIMGSDSDFPIVKSAVEELKEDEITEQDYLEFLGDDTEQIDIEDL